MYVNNAILNFAFVRIYYTCVIDNDLSTFHPSLMSICDDL